MSSRRNKHLKLAKHIAHRGVPWLEPENSLVGFELACTLGYQWVELDAQASLDGIAMVVHDDTVGPNKRSLLKLSSQELSTLEIAKDSSGKSVYVPTLTSCLDVMKKNSVSVVLEIKTSAGKEQADVEAVLACLEHRTSDNLIVSSFSAKALKIFALKNTQVSLALNTMKLTKELPTDCCNIHFDARSAEPFEVSNALEAGLGVYAYTVNDAKQYARLIKMGVHGVFTDNNELLKLS